MSLVRWNPWNLSSLLEDDWDLPTIPGVSRILGQGLNIYETDSNIVAEVALPGIQEDKIDVSIDEGIVRISATNDQTQEDKSNRKYFMSSMVQNYNYSFRLPDGMVESHDPEAVLNNGVLTLRFKKIQKAEPKKIKVISQDTSKQIETK
jgi:HSP20 family protein